MDRVPDGLPLDKDARLLLRRVRRRRFPNDLLPAFLLLEIVEMVVLLALPARHQGMVARFRICSRLSSKAIPRSTTTVPPPFPPVRASSASSMSSTVSRSVRLPSKTPRG